LLVLLQPLVRGWARYQGRLTRRELPLEAFESLDSLSRKTERTVPTLRIFWAPEGMTRMEFLRALLETLDRQGWHHRTDSGWSGFDLEVYGSRWCKLRLTTVTEPAPRGGVLVRCRLQSAWTLATRIGVWALLGLELAIIGLVPAGQPWWWLLLLSLPLVGWLVRRRQRDLRRIFGTFLDQFGAACGLRRLDASGNPIAEPVGPIPPGPVRVPDPAPASVVQ
jgi:hypothetical protein